MDWGHPEFVLSIIAMALTASVIKSAFHARYRSSKHELLHGPEARRNGGEVDVLRNENSRLIERLETHDDRIAVLERIVTDSSYRLGHEIEALREDKGKVQ